MVIETGKTFAKTPLTKIMDALMGKSYHNRALDLLYEQKRVGQVSKMTDSNLRLKLKDREALMEIAQPSASLAVCIRSSHSTSS
ncbi:hypothetical protein PsorP6_009228 [Peronosclerospora sorghi]|uniref:Uncharacterized protein n=1 Tax=Peronosclerospora sorghi TaxID=230839 RepID=A0ACC0VZY9_9STRA|nr:hypothetical protein PsorP6_009228 [Peronosclerospora sorghi]